MDEPLKDEDKEKDDVDLPVGDIDPGAVAPLVEPEEEVDVVVDDLGFGGEDEFGDPLIKPVKKGIEGETVDEIADEEDEELPDDKYDDEDPW